MLLLLSLATVCACHSSLLLTSTDASKKSGHCLVTDVGYEGVKEVDPPRTYRPNCMTCTRPRSLSQFLIYSRTDLTESKSHWNQLALARIHTLLALVWEWIKQKRHNFVVGLLLEVSYQGKSFFGHGYMFCCL